MSPYTFSLTSPERPDLSGMSVSSVCVCLFKKPSVIFRKYQRLACFALISLTWNLKMRAISQTPSPAGIKCKSALLHEEVYMHSLTHTHTHMHTTKDSFQDVQCGPLPKRVQRIGQTSPSIFAPLAIVLVNVLKTSFLQARAFSCPPPRCVCMCVCGSA